MEGDVRSLLESTSQYSSKKLAKHIAVAGSSEYGQVTTKCW